MVICASSTNELYHKEGTNDGSPIKSDRNSSVEEFFHEVPGQQPNEGHEHSFVGSPQSTKTASMPLLDTPARAEKFKSWPSPLTTASSVWKSGTAATDGWKKSPRAADYMHLGPLSADFITASPMVKLQSSESWRIVGSPTTKTPSCAFAASSFCPSDDSLDLAISSRASRQRAASVIDPLSLNLDEKLPQEVPNLEQLKWGESLGLKWTEISSEWKECLGDSADADTKDDLVLPKFGRARSKSQTIDPGCLKASEFDKPIWPKVGDFSPLNAAVSSLHAPETLAEKQRSGTMGSGEDNLDRDMRLLRLDDPFIGDDSTRSRSYSDSSKLPPFQLSLYKGPLYLIEFKAGRIEVYYVPESSGKPQMTVKVGDLVIVEADRGEDLGKITGEITVEKLKQLITPEDLAAAADRNDDGGNSPYGSLGVKEVIPKRIHRLAQPGDFRHLQAKAQEEAIAMVRCQSKVRQKKLPMEVVDAEYQWDRNKLTFYFVADRRIDFRELVRDLFRVYKTRIWMCAVDKNRTLYAKLRS